MLPTLTHHAGLRKNIARSASIMLFVLALLASQVNFTFAASPHDNPAYTIQPGDTLDSIATHFGVSVTAILKLNPSLGTDADSLTPGAQLILPDTARAAPPPVTVIIVILPNGAQAVPFNDTPVQSNTTAIQKDNTSLPTNRAPVQKIQAPIQTNPAPIQQKNVPAPAASAPVQKTTTPDSNTLRATAQNSGCGTHRFMWPSNDHSWISTFYSAAHRGIDIAIVTGTPIYASDSGVVMFAGWDVTGFGQRIMINHCSGWLTSYSHLKYINVGVGTWVAKGQVIGYSGSTGHSTGPHLDFRLMGDGGWLNPFLYLR